MLIVGSGISAVIYGVPASARITIFTGLFGLTMWVNILNVRAKNFSPLRDAHCRVGNIRSLTWRACQCEKHHIHGMIWIDDVGEHSECQGEKFFVPT